MKVALSLAVSLALALLFGLWPMASVLDDGYDVEVRTVPWRTQAGRLTRANPLGQGFRPHWNGLDRIDVGLVTLGPTEGEGLELVLRDRTRDGEILRTAPMPEGALVAGQSWVSFEFDPIEDSGGREFWFEFRLTGNKGRSPYSPWIRYHGHPGDDTPWGDRIASGSVHEGLLADFSPAGVAHPNFGHQIAPNLSALAFAAEGLEPARGEVRLELWEDESHVDERDPLRSVVLSAEEEVHGGFAFFAFEPIANSRHKRLHYRLTVNESARLVGFEQGLSVKTFHGGSAAGAELLGVSQGSALHADRSLVFRAHTRPTRLQVATRILERAGWKLAWGALCWILALAVLVHLALAKTSTTR